MFNVGDKVKFINKFNMYFPEFFPPPGTIGEVIFAEGENVPENSRGCWVKWPEYSLDNSKNGGEREFYCLNYRLEKVEEESNK